MQHTVSSARDPHAEIFLSKVLVEAGGGCLIYPMKPRPNGYCVINSGNKLRRAHRIAWELANHEPIPAGWVVDHICHNRACCNPEHLRICTQGQNLQNRKGAQPHSRTAVRGVTYRESTGRYIVKAKHQGHTYHGGCFADIHEAEQAAIALRNKLFTHNFLDRQGG